MEATGYDTQSVTQCLSAEEDWWDGQLNAAYRRIQAEFPSNLVAAVKDMQRAWIPYRDARCLYHIERWGTGSTRPVEDATCHLHMTADQTFLLLDILSDQDGP